MPYCCATLISAISAKAGGALARASAATKAKRRQSPWQWNMRIPAWTKKPNDDTAIIGARGPLLSMPCPDPRVKRSPREGLASSAFVESGQHEFAVSQGFGGRQTAIGSAEHHVQELVADLVHGDFTLQQPAGVDVDMLGHGAHGPRIGADLDHRKNRIADDVALSSGEEMHDESRCGAERHHLRRCRGAVHEPQAGTAGNFRLIDDAVDHALLADLLDVAQRLFLVDRESSRDIALGRLRIG